VIYSIRDFNIRIFEYVDKKLLLCRMLDHFGERWRGNQSAKLTFDLVLYIRHQGCAAMKNKFRVCEGGIAQAQCIAELSSTAIRRTNSDRAEIYCPVLHSWVHPTT
jgi:hypothetical protein